MEKPLIENQKRCLVTGATGVVGVPLVEALLQRNYRVKILARDRAAANLFAGKVVVVPGSLADSAALEAACADVDYVFHFAAKLHVNNPSARLDAEYEETNVRATANLLELGARNKIEKFVFASTINVYGAGDNVRIFDENSRLNPTGIYAQTKAAAEKLVLERDFGIVLRLAAVYGSRMKGNYVRLLTALRKHRFFFVGAGLNRRTLIHQRDAAAAAILVAEKAVGKSVYNATDGEYYTFEQIVRSMALALKLKTPSLRLPLAPFELAFDWLGIIERASGAKFPINRQTLDKLIEDVAVSGAKIQRELGFKPIFDLNAGWRETIENRDLKQMK